MLLNVKGRTVTINDELTNRYEKLGIGPVSELFALTEISAIYECRADDILETLSDEEIITTIENGIVDYCKVAGL